MTEEQKEALEAVEKINEELYFKYSKRNEKDIYKDWIAELPILSIVFASNYLFIGLTIPHTDACELPEMKIYNSECNDRLYYEKSDKYETFYKYIKRKFREIKEEINKVKL